MADQFKGNRTKVCGLCRGNGRTDWGHECDICGGTGKRRECLRAECKEFGCGGYGTCFEPAA